MFIVNPVSGKKDATRAMVPVIQQAAEAAGITPEFEMTEAPKHATYIASTIAGTGQAVRLYSVGGDGTLNEIFAGAYPFPNAQVACLPCGSGNDFIRMFGDAQQFLDIGAQIQGEAVPIDLMEVDGGICAAITSTGLDADVAYNIPKYRRIPFLGGSMAYNISIVEKLLKPLGRRLHITVDGESWEDDYLIATVCNAQHYGGGYQAAPMARLDDGQLDVILVKKVSRLLIASIIGPYKKGEHYVDGRLADKFKDVMVYRSAKEVEMHPVYGDSFVLNVDGECGPAPRLFAKVMPKAARFVLPAPLAAAYKTQA
ncbi:protein BmrU [Ruminococcaceae bacterium OttesenSCG-928-O06]|nr:protein BmrU [Ruminococcaceae bacterium OttesenSCG-928-O06]